MIEETEQAAIPQFPPDMFVMFRDMLRIMADPKGTAAVLEGIEQRSTALDEREKAISVRKSTFADHEQRTRAELGKVAAEQDKAWENIGRQRDVLVKAPVAKIQALANSIGELERRFAPIAMELPGGGARAPEWDGLSPIQRVRLACGLPAGPQSGRFCNGTDRGRSCACGGRPRLPTA